MLILPEQLLGPVIHQLQEDAALAARVAGILVQPNSSAGEKHTQIHTPLTVSQAAPSRPAAQRHC